MKKNLFITVAIIVGVVAAYLVLFPGKKPWQIFKRKKAGAILAGESASAVTSAETGNPMNPDTKPITKDSDGFPITYGDKGNLVAAIQEGLNLKFGSALSVDGIFGPKTRKALGAHGYSDTITREQYLEIVA